MAQREWIVPELGIGTIFGLEEIEAILCSLKSPSLSWAEWSGRLSEAFAHYTGAPHAVPTPNCTTALRLVTQIIGLGPEDEVVLVAQSYRATSVPFLACGAAVRFADVDADSLTADPESIRRQITPRTRAVCVMHYGGRPCEMDEIMAVAREHDLFVIEDAAHAPGAAYKGRKIGAIGDFTAFSFQSLKNMTALGEGGMLTVQREEWAEQARELCRMGSIGRWEPRERPQIGPYLKPDFEMGDHAGRAWEERLLEWTQLGHNYRVSQVACAVALEQLKKLDAHNARRRALGHRLNERLRDLPKVRLLIEPDYLDHVYHLYAFRYLGGSQAKRNEVIRILREEKRIEVILRYWPLHLQSEFETMGHRFGECPVVERVFFEEQINLPMAPKLTEDQIDYMAESVAQAIARVEG